MGNPYYVEPQSSLGQIIDPMLKIANMRQNDANFELQAQQLAEAKRQHTITNYGTATPAPGAVSIPQQDIDIRRQELANNTAKVPEYLQNFGRGDEALYQVMAKKANIPENSLITQKVKQLVADSNVDKLTAFHIVSNDPDLQADYITHRQKDFEAKAGKIPNYASTPEGKKQYDELQGLSNPENWKQITSTVFGKTIQSYMADMNSKRTALTIDQVKGQYAQSLLAKADALEANGNSADADKIRKIAQTAMGVIKPDNSHQVQELTSPDGTRAQKFQYNPETQRFDVPLGPPYKVKSQVTNINVRSGNPSGNNNQVETLAAGILDGTIDPSSISKRGNLQGAVYARVKKLDPSFNITQATARARMATNVNLQNKAGIAEILPELINQTKELGKKLNYSNFKPFGKVGMAWDSATNDPNYIEYMTKRNDLILTIGGVMRANGMTDMAQRLEEDSAPRSMAPRAFDAWAKGQMDSLEPRIKMYRSQMGTKGTPQSNTGTAPTYNRRSTDSKAPSFRQKYNY